MKTPQPYSWRDRPSVSVSKRQAEPLSTHSWWLDPMPRSEFMAIASKKYALNSYYMPLNHRGFNDDY